MMNNGFDDKDAYRIKNIVLSARHKAQDYCNQDWDLMFDCEAGILARRMANSITRADKALRRAEAALAIGQTKIAAIFFVRAGQLGAQI